jgi:EmrB/QacA subfamily drug resistance transporter
MLPMYMAVQDQTIVASALPAMAASLGEVERISWIVVAYLVAATIAAPVYGYLGDTFGRRKLMFVALGVFTAASIMCSLSTSILMLASARALQGLGGGGLMSLSQALIGEIVPPRQRGHYQGYLATVATTAAVLGPVAGGFLTDHFGWPSIFWFNMPLCAIALVLMLRLPPRRAAPRADFSFDSLGLLYFVTFVVPVLLALEQARRFNINSVSMIVALLALAIVSLFLLLRQEKRATSPLLPIEMFRRAPIWRANGLAMCHGAALTSLVAFLPIYFRVVHGASASRTGMLLLPISFFIGIGSILTGRLVTRTGSTMIWPTLGLIGATATFVIFALALKALSLSELMVVLGVAAFCMGTVMAVVQVTVQTEAGRKFVGAAAGSVQFSRTVGAAFGTALMASVLFATLGAIDPEAATIFANIVNSGPSALDSLDAARRLVIEGEIASAFRAAFLLLVAFTGAGIWLAASNPSRRVQ